jgi:hypothetical protein
MCHVIMRLSDVLNTMADPLLYVRLVDASSCTSLISDLQINMDTSPLAVLLSLLKRRTKNA